jgi:hypothetical protein
MLAYCYHRQVSRLFVHARYVERWMGDSIDTYALTPYSLATSGTPSTSTFANTILPGLLCDDANCSNMGAICLHGPHHVAWKSVITYVLLVRSCEK